MNRIPRILTLLLALAGVAVSLYLVWTHHQITANPEYQSICNINATFNCDVVNASRFSEVWGIPLALYGAGFYLATLVLGLMSLGSSERAESTPALVWGLSLMAVFLSVVLGYISAVEVKAWCVMCISLYIINAGLLATSWWSVGESFGGMVSRLDEQLRALLSNPAIFAAAAVFFGTLWIGNATLDASAPASAEVGPQDAVDAGEKLLNAYRSSPVVDIPLTGEEPFKGGPNATVVIVEFADFECPWCSKASDSLYTIADTFGDQVKIIYKHFPLDNKCNPLMGHALHENACAASIASICAGQQGQFWPMHKTLFANQGAQGEEELVSYASALGLDMDAWGACRQGMEASAALNEDIRAAGIVKVEATPTVLVNGRLMKGQEVVRPELMEILIRDLLDASKQ